MSELNKDETVCISIGTTIKLKDELERQSKRFLITKSRAAHIILDYCLKNGILYTLKTN